MKTLFEELLKEIELKSAKKPYPVLVKNLKNFDIESYEVTVSTHDRTFRTNNGEEQTIKGTLPQLVCAQKFNLDAVRVAVKRTQQKQTDYPTFLKEIAEAGIHTYIADLKEMRIIYKGKTAGEEYAENIPVVA